MMGGSLGEFNARPDGVSKVYCLSTRTCHAAKFSSDRKSVVGLCRTAGRRQPSSGKCTRTLLT